MYYTKNVKMNTITVCIGPRVAACNVGLLTIAVVINSFIHYVNTDKINVSPVIREVKKIVARFIHCNQTFVPVSPVPRSSIVSATTCLMILQKHPIKSL